MSTIGICVVYISVYKSFEREKIIDFVRMFERKIISARDVEIIHLYGTYLNALQ